MEARTRLALSGAAVIAVSMSVVASVVATSAVALAETPGTTIGAHAVRLPAPVATSSADAGANVAVAAPAASTAPVASAAPIAPVAETVPAPAPVVVAPTQAAVAAPPTDVEDEILATGSWDAVHEWASTNGWTSADVDAWISRFEATHKLTQDGAVVSPESSQKTPQTPASAGLSDTVATTPGDGSKKDRSHGSPDHSD